MEEFAYESASDHLSDHLGPIDLESRVYIDQLEREELEELEPRGKENRIIFKFNFYFNFFKNYFLII